MLWTIEFYACESCSEVLASHDLDKCPVCGRYTCQECQAFDEDDHFVICEACINQLELRNMVFADDYT